MTALPDAPTARCPVCKGMTFSRVVHSYTCPGAPPLRPIDEERESQKPVDAAREARNARIRSLRMKGVSIRLIAEEVGCSKVTVWSVLSREDE